MLLQIKSLGVHTFPRYLMYKERKKEDILCFNILCFN